MRSYSHTDYMKYCNMSDFIEPFCVYLQYFLDTTESIHNQIARTSYFQDPAMSQFPHPASCPPAELSWTDWKEAWEECSDGLDITVYCDAVLLAPKELKRMIIPFNEYHADNYAVNMRFMGVNANRGLYDARELYRLTFSNDVDQMIEGLESRVGEAAPMYRCLTKKLGTTAWEPEMFASGCSHVDTLQDSTVLGEDRRKNYTINLLKEFYDLST